MQPFEFGRFGFDPFLEMRRLQSEMNRLFSGVGTAGVQQFPPINLWLGENSVVVTAALPGVSPDTVDLTVHENTLTLQGRREPKAEDADATWHRRERSYGSFSRTVQLPIHADPDQVQARFINGVLEIELKRPEADRPKKIRISAA
jgi:HSP20 family protein